MTIGSIPLFTALAEKMKWHQARQSLLAENVANAETPGYDGRDLAAYGFEQHMRRLSGPSVTPVATAPGHISWSGMGSAVGFEVTSQRGVTLEDEMMKIAANQMDYQAATSLYSRSMRLLKTALGRQ